MELDYSEEQEALEYAAEIVRDAGYETAFDVSHYSEGWTTGRSEDSAEEALEEFAESLEGDIIPQVRATPEDQEHPDDLVDITYVSSDESYIVNHPTGDVDRENEVESLLEQ